MHEVKTLPHAEPSEPGVAVPLVKHLVEKAPDPANPGKWLSDQLADTTLCGRPWDRLLDLAPPRNAPTCDKCLFQAAMDSKGVPQ